MANNYLRDIILPKNTKYKKTPMRKEAFEQRLRYLASLINEIEILSIKNDTGLEDFLWNLFSKENLSDYQLQRIFKEVFSHPNDLIQTSAMYLFNTFITKLHLRSRELKPKTVHKFFEYFRKSTVYESLCDDVNAMWYLFPFNDGEIGQKCFEALLDEFQKTDLKKECLIKILNRNQWKGLYYRGYENILVINDTLENFFIKIPGLDVNDFLLEDNIDDFSKN